MSGQPFVLFDVDGCLLDFHGEPMPGVTRLLDTVRLLGFQVRVWSAGGEKWARKAADSLGATEARCYDKPDYPPTEADALVLLGSRPALQVDDDATERIADWPFMLVAASPLPRSLAASKSGGGRPGADE